jgi:hypothetical protein
MQASKREIIIALGNVGRVALLRVAMRQLNNSGVHATGSLGAVDITTYWVLKRRASGQRVN